MIQLPKLSVKQGLRGIADAVLLFICFARKFGWINVPAVFVYLLLQKA